MIGTGDDSQIVGAVSELPGPRASADRRAAAPAARLHRPDRPDQLPRPRRLDRREWAWVTMPALIAIFAVGAYGYGSALRGSDVIVNEVAIVRGAPDATEGSAQVYLGVFSPTRGTYQLSLPGGALLSAPVVGDFFAGQGALLDVVQGEPPGPRTCPSGSGRSGRSGPRRPSRCRRSTPTCASSTASSTGTIRNDSAVILESPAVVLGGNVVVLADIPPGAEGAVSLRLTAEPVRPGASRTRSSARSSSPTTWPATRNSAATRPATGSSTS